LVEKEEDIDFLHGLLCEQDSYWKDYRHIIQVGEKTINSMQDLDCKLENCGKTDIYDIESLRTKCNFILFFT
jgi:hypothetical protein